MGSLPRADNAWASTCRRSAKLRSGEVDFRRPPNTSFEWRASIGTGEQRVTLGSLPSNSRTCKRESSFRVCWTETPWSWVDFYFSFANSRPYRRSRHFQTHNVPMGGSTRNACYNDASLLGSLIGQLVIRYAPDWSEESSNIWTVARTRMWQRLLNAHAQGATYIGVELLLSWSEMETSCWLNCEESVRNCQVS